MSTLDIPLDKAELLAVILEALLYGFSLFMFGGSIWALSSQRSTLGVNYKMLTVSCSLLLFSTLHLVIDIVRVMRGFILHPDTRIEYFSDISNWTFVSKNYVYAAQTLIGDGVVLYRCHAVWQDKRVMVVPLLLWLGVGVTGFACPFIEAHTKQGDVFNRILSPWVTAFWSTTLTTNVLTTLLLSYRIWYVDRKTSRVYEHRESKLRPALHIIIDAGLVYSCTLFVALACYSRHSNGQYVILDMIMPIISITFYMVIIRMGLARRANQPTHPHLTVEITGHSLSMEPRSRVQVDVTRLTEQETKGGPRNSMRPMSLVSSENKHREVKFDDIDVEEQM